MEIKEIWDKEYRVLVADDHKLFRQSLRGIVGRISGIKYTGEACNGREVLQKVSEAQWDLILLDISMPEMDGFETLRSLQANESPPVIVISMHFDEGSVSRAFNLGAKGYLNKDCDIGELTEAIYSVLQGETFFSSQAQHYVVSSFTKREETGRQPLPRLSAEEIRVLKLICGQKTTREISVELNISEPLTNTHRINLLRKTNSINVAGLVLFAIKNRYISA